MGLPCHRDCPLSTQGRHCNVGIRLTCGACNAAPCLPNHCPTAFRPPSLASTDGRTRVTANIREHSHVTQGSTHFWTASDGVELAFHELGQGRPVVLLHGLFSDANMNWIKFGHAE